MIDFAQSFCTIYRDIFAAIVRDEHKYGDPDAYFPTFGYSHTPWNSNLPKSEPVIVFYNHWKEFSTTKDFSWIVVANEEEGSRKAKKYVFFVSMNSVWILSFNDD